MKKFAEYLLLPVALMCLALGCDDDDNTAGPEGDGSPTVAITAPVNNASVADLVEIEAVASDDKGVSKVEFFVDAVLIHTDPAPPYQAFWDAWAEENGSNHMIYAVAYDTDENKTGSTAILCTIDTTVGAPSVPTLYAIQNITDSSVLVTWSMNADADFQEYELFYDSSTSDDPSLYSAVITSAADTSVTLTNLYDNVNYRFQLHVEDIYGRRSASDIVEATTLDVAPPASTIIGIYSYSEGKRISWSAADIWDFANYKVYQSADAVLTEADDLIADISVITTTYVEYETDDTAGYYYFVSVTDLSGNVTVSEAHYSEGHSANYALHFDGTKYATVPYFPALNVGDTYTLEAWVYMTSTVTYMRVIDKSPDGDPYLQYALICDPEVGADVCTGDDWARFHADDGVALEEWHHVAYTYNEGTIIYFIDGQPVDTTVSGITSTCSSETTLNIGRRKLFDEFYFRGNIDDVRVWTVVRTPVEIASAYNTHLTGSETGLVCYFDFDEGVGDIIFSPVGGNGYLGDVSGADANDPTWVESTAPIAY